MRLIILIMFIGLASCKTKEIIIENEKQLSEINKHYSNQSDNKTDVRTKSEISQSEFKELVQLMSQLDIQFDGKSIDDKLELLLNKTSEGTKLTFSGVGKANYSETQKIDVEQIKIELLKQHDSLFKQALNDIKIQNEYHLNEYYKKEKQVKVKGFQAGAYITIGAVLIVLFMLWRLLKKFNLF